MGADQLAHTIETSADELVGELKAVRDSVEELYILLDHVWRNREELHDILAGIIEKRTEESNEVTCCRVERWRGGVGFGIFWVGVSPSVSQ